MNRLVLGAASAAMIGLTACTHAAAPASRQADSAAPHASHSSTSSTTSAAHAPGTHIVPISCSQQYHSWMHRDGKGLMGALDAVTSAATARHSRALTKALQHAKPAVAKAARHPIPACADPRGYWTVLLMHVNAATAGNGGVSSVRAAMQDVQKIHQELVTEVKQLA